MDLKQLQVFLNQLHQKYSDLTEGIIATHIEEVTKADPIWFNICIVTVNGQTCNVCNTSKLFTMQSISKPFVYGLALEDHGKDYISKKIGVEPTGTPFNSILENERITKRSYNPMVNAGAIATTSLIKGATQRERQNRLLHMFERYIGREEILVDHSVFMSKRVGDNINRAIAYIMLNENMIEGNIDEVLDLYYTQCSILIDCCDLAVMGATLANNGINPITGKPAIDAIYIRDMLSIMYTCGLYDFSGQWAYLTGIPAKSGLTGAIMAVVPNKMGIAVFSPPLGEHNKSIRGVKVCIELSEHLQLGVFSKINAIFPEEDIKRKKEQAERELQRDNDGLIDTPVQESYHLQDIDNFLHYLHTKYKPLRDGDIYFSETGITRTNPDWFGICIVTTTGDIYQVGDCEIPFLIQSISKVFTYGLALEDHGRDYVLTKVDVEPTGDAYNGIIKLEEDSKRPHNPMVNTGAIAITSLIKGSTPAKRLNRVLSMYKCYIGHQVFVDMPTFVSERNKGDRNIAISYLLRNFNMISGNIEHIIDLYLQQCSVILNCKDMAMMAVTLANNGINPVTEEQAIKPLYVKDLLNVMFTCGMYDFAGEWVYDVGLPAKSGVSGAIMAVVPNKMGIAVFSPPIDKRGNSVRGIKVCQELSKRFKLHIFEK